MARTVVDIRAFEGIDQGFGAHNLKMSVAHYAENINTEHGAISPAKGFMEVYPPLAEPIVTLCSFYRRNHLIESERRVLVASTATKLYSIVEGASAWKLLMSDLGSGEWSFVTYETVRDNGTPGDDTDDYTTDVLILSNPVDGVVVVYGDVLEAEKKDDLPKFAIIERHAERIWGTGVPGEPDNLYYSRPLNPFDWSQVFDSGSQVLLDESGGVISVPTWDGDKFVALRRFSNQLLAFKEKSAWYVRGVTAGEFAVIEGYGSDGVFAPATIITDGPLAFYLADGGLGVYDGDTAQLVDNDRLHNVFRMIGANAPSLSCAIVSKHVLYLSIPVKIETYTETVGEVTVTRYVEPVKNNMLIEYDIRRRTYMIRTGIQADALHNHGGRILFTSGDNPSQVYEFAGTDYDGVAIPVKWVSSWQDGGAKNTVKSGFVIHITGFDIAEEDSQEITLSIETEKKKKSKVVAISSGLKKTRFPINNSGKRYRLMIESASNVDWSILGGMQIEMEVDEI